MLTHSFSPKSNCQRVRCAHIKRVNFSCIIINLNLFINNFASLLSHKIRCVYCFSSVCFISFPSFGGCCLDSSEKIFKSTMKFFHLPTVIYIFFLFFAFVKGSQHEEKFLFDLWRQDFFFIFPKFLTLIKISTSLNNKLQ